ncbi:DNA-binding helix-turn-helix protein [Lactobacillus gasseri MV-22]|nr:DNA-binding helix-turn-helix protein [Lactobacillus gasseri MV-22]
MIGDRIRELRTSHRLSQTELSKLLHVSQQTITKWENGKAEPSSGALAKLAEYFDVSADYLLGSDKTSEPKSVDLEKTLSFLAMVDALCQMKTWTLSRLSLKDIRMTENPITSNAYV